MAPRRKITPANQALNAQRRAETVPVAPTARKRRAAQVIGALADTASSLATTLATEKEDAVKEIRTELDERLGPVGRGRKAAKRYSQDELDEQVGEAVSIGRHQGIDEGICMSVRRRYREKASDIAEAIEHAPLPGNACLTVGVAAVHGVQVVSFTLADLRHLARQWLESQRTDGESRQYGDVATCDGIALTSMTHPGSKGAARNE